MFCECPAAVAIFLCVDTSICKERINRRLSEKEGRKCESGISLDYLDRLDCEIKQLADSLRCNTIVKDLPWTAERSDDAIARVCEGFALDIKARELSVYDFWTGINRIGA